MDRATLERIFEPFYTTKSAGTGTGLGLAIAHGIMHSHGGAILVQSEPGRGSTFELYFPVHRGDAVAAQSAPPLDQAPFAPGCGQQILLVDDEEAIVQLGQVFLARLGYRVTAFSDPQAALAAFRLDARNFAAAIVDLTMPKLNGLELAQQLLALRPDLPVILVTGYYGKLNADQARALGIREVLPKPTTIDSLGAALGRAFAAR
jgi:CheY-like chemotaxis protein